MEKFSKQPNYTEAMHAWATVAFKFLCSNLNIKDLSTTQPIYTCLKDYLNVFDKIKIQSALKNGKGPDYIPSAKFAGLVVNDTLEHVECEPAKSYLSFEEQDRVGAPHKIRTQNDMENFHTNLWCKVQRLQGKIVNTSKSKVPESCMRAMKIFEDLMNTSSQGYTVESQEGAKRTPGVPPIQDVPAEVQNSTSPTQVTRVYQQQQQTSMNTAQDNTNVSNVKDYSSDQCEESKTAGIVPAQEIQESKVHPDISVQIQENDQVNEIAWSDSDDYQELEEKLTHYKRMKIRYAADDYLSKRFNKKVYETKDEISAIEKAKKKEQEAIKKRDLKASQKSDKKGKGKKSQKSAKNDNDDEEENVYVTPQSLNKTGPTSQGPSDVTSEFTAATSSKKNKVLKLKKGADESDAQKNEETKKEDDLEKSVSNSQHDE